MSNELNVKNGIQERRDVMAKMVGVLAYGGCTFNALNNEMIVINCGDKRPMMIGANSVSEKTFEMLFNKAIDLKLVEKADLKDTVEVAKNLDSAMSKIEQTPMGIAGFKSLNKIGDGIFGIAADYVNGYLPKKDSMKDFVAVNTAI